jgi:hypothetical protein
MTSAAAAMDKRDPNRPSTPGPGSTDVVGDETFHVFGSGNLGLVYVRGEKQRLDRRELHRRFPSLVTGLSTHPGIGFVVVMDDDGPVVLGSRGSHRLDDGHVEGEDPLLPFGPDAPAFVARVAHRPEAPDIYVNSTVDPATLEVSAFEGLVGSHGGLGGWQDRGLFLAPSSLLEGLDLDDGDHDIRGAEQLHQVLVAMLVGLGHRSNLQRPVGTVHQ